MNIDLLPVDPVFPKLSEALDSKRMTEILRRELCEPLRSGGHSIAGCVPDYVRYKPGVSCIIGYALYLSRNGDSPGFVQRVHGRFLAEDRSEEDYRKALKTHTATPPWGPPMAYFRDLAMIVSFFPNDRSLRGLRFVLDPHKLKRVAQSRLVELVRKPWWVRGRRTRIEILSYKPERHCVARCILGLRNVKTGEKKEVSVIGKILGVGEGERVSAVNQRVWNLRGENGETPLIPEPLAFDPDFSLFFQEEVDGCHPIPYTVAKGEWYRQLRLIARRLRAFHELKIDVSSKEYPVDRFGELGASIRNTAEVLPGKRRELLELLEHLDRVVPVLTGIPEGPIHGDFHLKQVIMTETGPVILDLDAIRQSAYVEDVANLAAHLYEFKLENYLSQEELDEAEEEIIQGYFREGEYDRIESAYRWHVKAALVRLALSRLKYLLPNWQGQMEFFLNEAGNLELSG